MIDERGYPWPPGAIEWARDRARLVFGVTLSEEQAATLCELCYVQGVELDTALIALGACGACGAEERRRMTVERLAEWERAYSQTYGAVQQRLYVAMCDLVDAVKVEIKWSGWGWRLAWGLVWAWGWVVGVADRIGRKMA